LHVFLTVFFLKFKKRKIRIMLFNQKINMKLKSFLIFLIALFAFARQNAHSQQVKTLKTAFKNDFLMGAALGSEYILEKNATANRLIKSEFNSITPENIMKAEVIHPEKGRYDFSMADKFVAYGQKNKMYIVGHTLVWHSQLTKYANEITNADSLRKFMRDHILTVAGRYAGKVNSWDVVNEALNEDGTMRESIFYKQLGDGYIKEAFDLAAKADPKAKLYYNDYNIEQPAKRAGAIALIKKLKASGTKIDGVGIQGHWSLLGASIEEIEATIIAFSELGVKVAFTELDFTVIPNPWDLKGAEVNQSFASFEGDPKMNPYPKSLPDSVQKALTKRYEDIFKLFLKHKDKISRVTFWGVNDGHSWLNGWPIKGRTNYPLLFDRDYLPKPAYRAVLKLKK
jgi:endo-1,4-beta-xylanase